MCVEFYDRKVRGQGQPGTRRKGENFLSFFMILMLIFIIQTIWIFIDEFAGKGLDISVILKFLLYYSPKLVPLVLPLTVLLASIMSF